jgi:hypothetical protein
LPEIGGRKLIPQSMEAHLLDLARRDKESHAIPQPAPTGNGAVVLDAVLEDFRVRGEMGLKKYGTKLRTFNGRNALVDLYQELQDACLYAKQRLMEEDARHEN